MERQRGHGAAGYVAGGERWGQAGDYDDIATQLGVPVGTVKSRIHYARVHVRRSLAVNL